MESRAYALVTGVFLVVLISGGAFVAVWLGRETVSQVPYEIVSQYPVTGLKAQASVTYRGVDVGSVQSIRFDPHHPEHVLVDITIRPDVPVTSHTYAKLRQRGVTGLAEVELNGSESGTRLTTSSAHPAQIPMRPSLLAQVSSSGEELLHNLNQLTQRMNHLLSRDNQARVTRILQNLEAATAELTRLQSQAAPAVRALPRLEAHANRTLQHLDTLMQGSLRKQTLPQLNATLDELSRSARSIRQLADSLRRRPSMLLEGNPGTPGPGEPGYQTEHNR